MTSVPNEGFYVLARQVSKFFSLIQNKTPYWQLNYLRHRNKYWKFTSHTQKTQKNVKQVYVIINDIG